MLFHHFSLTWTLVVDSTKMQNAMNDDTMKLALVSLAKLLRIGAHGIEADDDIARDLVALGIVECDDIGIIIVLQELLVALEDSLVVDELVAHLAQTHPVQLGNLLDPCTYVTFADVGHLDAFAKKRNSHTIYNIGINEDKTLEIALVFARQSYELFL